MNEPISLIVEANCPDCDWAWSATGILGAGDELMQEAEGRLRAHRAGHADDDTEASHG